MLKSALIFTLLSIAFGSITGNVDDVETTTVTSSTVQPSTKKYYVITEPRTFVGAIIACKTAGLELASIESAEEQAAVASVIANSEYSTADGYWIGGADETTSSSDWYWISTGFKMVYTNWGTSQPRYYSSDSSVGYCVRMGNFYKVNQVYNWENVNCDYKLYVICQAST